MQNPNRSWTERFQVALNLLKEMKPNWLTNKNDLVVLKLLGVSDKVENVYRAPQ
jgi:hypothetical protein